MRTSFKRRYLLEEVFLNVKFRKYTTILALFRDCEWLQLLQYQWLMLVI